MKHFYNASELLLFLDALSNPYRLKIIVSLKKETQYVSQLARNLDISRALLYLHLKKLEEANIVRSKMELLESGKNANFYSLNSFDFSINESIIESLILKEEQNKEDNY